MRNKISALAAAVLAAAALSACSNGGGGMSASTGGSSSGAIEAPTEAEVIPAEEAPTEAAGKYDGVADAAEGPLLTVSNTTAKPGEVAEVTISVSNADLKWNMCGLHITYPDVLKCRMFDEEDRLVEVRKGKAVNYATGTVAMLWRDNLPDEMVEKKLMSVFFTAIFDENRGQDGDIATYYFEVPEDAESGTVYPIEYYYYDTDIFSNLEGDLAFEKYAFEHWTGGSITVE